MTDNQRTKADEQMLKALFADDFKGMEDAIKKGASLNTPYNESGYTPFLKICKEHISPDIIEWGINHGGSVTQTTINKETPLHIMANRRSFFDALEVLIAHGADVNAQDINGDTPLMHLLAHPQVKLRMGVVWGLYDAGTDCMLENTDGQTAYDIAEANPGFKDDEFLLVLLSDAIDAQIRKNEQIPANSNKKIACNN